MRQMMCFIRLSATGERGHEKIVKFLMKFKWLLQKFSLESHKPTPASTAATSPSETGDITIAPTLVKNKFDGTVLGLISLNDPSDMVNLWCASVLIIYKELSGFTVY